MVKPESTRSPLNKISNTSVIPESSSSSAMVTNSKSSLKRSKSFGHRTEQYVQILSGGSGVDGQSKPGTTSELTMEHQQLVRRALESPKSLVTTQLMEVVRIIVNKALERLANAHPMSKICMSIIDKEKGKIFLESLMNCCREWFNERERLIKAGGGSGAGSQGTTNPRRWPSYVAFLTELYLALRCKQRHVRLITGLDEPSKNEGNSTTIGGAIGGQVSDEDIEKRAQLSLIQKQLKNLATLLYDCCSALINSAISPSATSATSDIESLQSALRTVGRFMADDHPQRMSLLMASVREAFISCQQLNLSSMNQKNLMEIIEYRASNWNFSASQQLYYFPYTAISVQQ